MDQTDEFAASLLIVRQSARVAKIFGPVGRNITIVTEITRVIGTR